ncbi:MAG: hypothetical protein PHO74_04735 [Weeksellaceae bacterium]|jgi:uncharacterized membrane protein YciS (DUF1049 family)|nr:hypothetical protein [Weeksellaceae bacterium]
MKYAFLIGILLISIGLVATFIAKIEFGELITQPEFALGLLYGGGTGLLLGGFLGWLYKKSHYKKHHSETGFAENPGQTSE